MAPKYALEDRLVLFMDFLGFKEFAERADERETDLILQILADLATRQGAYQQNVTRTGSQSVIRMTPATTAFSDHIVLSFPITDPDHQEDHPSARLFALLSNAQYHAATIARMALQVGMLVRGGLTIGKLFHPGGVVYGPAMNEAYALESRVSIYPRIAVSPAVVVDQNLGGFLTTDSDGLRHLDYVHMMVMLERNPADTSLDAAIAAVVNLQTFIDSKVAALASQASPEALSVYAKWWWFKEKFDRAASKKLGVLRGETN